VLPASLGNLRVLDHPATVDRAVRQSAEHAGVLQLGLQLPGLTLSATRYDCNLTAGRPLAVEQHIANLLSLVRDAQQLHPVATRRQAARPQRRVALVVAPPELRPTVAIAVAHTSALPTATT
jgi:hypothetical protein